MKSMIRLLMCALALPCAASFCPAVAGTVQVTPVLAFGPLLRDGVGRQVGLPVLAAGDGDPRGGRRHRSERAWLLSARVGAYFQVAMRLAR